MANENENTIARITKLENGNYFAWHLRVKAYLIDKNCWNAVDPGFGELMNIDQERLNKKALSILYQSVGDDFLFDIENCVRAKEAWEILEEIHNSFTKFHALQALKEMVNVGKTCEVSMQEYTGKIQRLNKKVAKGGINLSDEILANLFLAGLPSDDYEVFVQNVLKEPILTTRLVKGRMLDEERRRLQRASSENEVTALTAFKKNGKIFRQDAREPVPRVGESTVKTCYRCHKAGHISKFCPSIDCKRCGNYGHWAKDCRSDTKIESKNVKSQAPRGEGIGCVSVCALLSSSNNYQWVLDSGATEHMTSRRELFETFEPMKGRVQLGKGLSVVEGKGSLSVTLSDKNGGCVLKMKNVLYVPDLNFNLVSVSKLTENDVTVSFVSDKAEGVKNDLIVFTAFQNSGLFVLESADPIPVDSEVERISLVTKSDNGCGVEECEDVVDAIALRSISTVTWHRRLGHIHARALSKVPGVIDVKTEDLNDCSVCVQGKFTKLSVPKQSERISREPLDLVHSDLMSMSHVTNGGALYLISFIDDCTRYAQVKFLRKKSDAGSKFKEYIAEAELFHGRRIRSIQTDGGGEYCNKEFQSFLSGKGIVHRRTVPHSPHQNGIAERFNRTLEDMIRCMLIESGLPFSFWGEAASTACKIRNLCPSSAVQNAIPAELWFNQDMKQEVLRLRVFGCRAWLAQNNGKLGARATEHVFLGYEPNVKGYRLYDMETKKVIVGLHIRFEETVFPFRCNSDKEALHKEISYFCVNNSESNEAIDAINDDIHVNIEEPRRSCRVPKPKRCVCCNLATCYMSNNNLGNVTEPLTAKQAMSSSYSKKWIEAMDLEYCSMMNLKVWDIVERPVDYKVIGCKWIFKVKCDDAGNVERFKARLVAQGFKNEMGFPWEDTFSPVIRKKSIRVLLAVAVENEWCAHHMDVTTAYLNSPVSQDIYMEQPEFYEDKLKGRDGFVCKLNRSIYGLPCASKDWNECLDKLLKDMEFSRCKSDSCVYVKTDIIVGIYIDDLVVVGKYNLVCEFKEEFSKLLIVRDLGKVSQLLSMHVEQEKGKILIEQSCYIKKLLSECSMNECKPCVAPLSLAEEVDCALFENVSFYRRVVGSLLFLANNYRCDIAYAVSKVSQACKSPTVGDWRCVKHILRYLQGTIDLCLSFERRCQPVKIFCDATWNSEPKGKSIGGFVVIFAGGALTWHSRKQSCVAMSTQESEFISMSEAVREVIWLRNLFSELKQEKFIEIPCCILCDNTQAIRLGQTGVVTERSKHIDLKYHFCCEQVERGNVVFKYIPSDANVSDMFTKPLPGPKVKFFNSMLGLQSK